MQHWSKSKVRRKLTIVHKSFISCWFPAYAIPRQIYGLKSPISFENSYTSIYPSYNSFLPKKFRNTVCGSSHRKAWTGTVHRHRMNDHWFLVAFGHEYHFLVELGSRSNILDMSDIVDGIGAPIVISRGPNGNESPVAADGYRRTKIIGSPFRIKWLQELPLKSLILMKIDDFSERINIISLLSKLSSRPFFAQFLILACSQKLVAPNYY